MLLFKVKTNTKHKKKFFFLLPVGVGDAHNRTSTLRSTPNAVDIELYQKLIFVFFFIFFFDSYFCYILLAFSPFFSYYVLGSFIF